MTPSKPACLTAIPRDIAAITDYEPYARERLDDNAWAYLAGGAGDEITLRENRAAFDRMKLRGHVLADVRGGHTRIDLFGRHYAHPILLAPVAYQQLFHRDGELATAMAASVMETCMVISTLASTPVEAIAAHTQAPIWFQLYFRPRREQTLALVRRAEAAGAIAIVATVDAPLGGIRYREHRVGFHLPPHVSPVNLPPTDGMPALQPGQSVIFDQQMAQAPTWQDIEWLTAATHLPVLVKGILEAEDARRAIDHGAAGIVVSNHGGRVLDTLPSSIEALPGIADAVAGRVPLLLDGGIRRGTDIIKAVAFGASAVLVGRPYVHGLAAAGPLGVAHVIRTLREELEIAMAVCGHASLAAIDRSAIRDGS